MIVPEIDRGVEPLPGGCDSFGPRGCVSRSHIAIGGISAMGRSGRNLGVR